MFDDFRLRRGISSSRTKSLTTAVEMPMGMETTESEIHIPEELPILPVRDTVVFPRTIAPLSVGKPRSRAIDQRRAGRQ